GRRAPPPPGTPARHPPKGAGDSRPPGLEIRAARSGGDTVRRVWNSLLPGLLALSLPGPAPAAELEQVVTHEHPLFKPREARLTVRRDGRVYLANWGVSSRPYGLLMRLDRAGDDRDRA